MWLPPRRPRRMTIARPEREKIRTMGHQRAAGNLDARIAMAQDRRTAPTELFELASDPSVLVRAAVAARPDAPAEALRPLARDRDRTVREAVAKNPATSQGNLLRLVADADRKVRWAVAANPACDARVRQAMVKAQDKELRGLLAEMPALEPEVAAILVDDASPEVRERLASHTHDPDIISALLRDRTVRVRKGVAINQRITAEQRHVLAQDSSPDVRATLVRAMELDEGDLRSLLDDRSVEVRRSMATSAVTPDHIRLELEKDGDETVADDARRYRRSQAADAPAAPPRGGHRRPIGKRFPGKTAR
jgi:Leucine rich repeat variant